MKQGEERKCKAANYLMHEVEADMSVPHLWTVSCQPIKELSPLSLLLSDLSAGTRAQGLAPQIGQNCLTLTLLS